MGFTPENYLDTITREAFAADFYVNSFGVSRIHKCMLYIYSDLVYLITIQFYVQVF